MCLWRSCPLIDQELTVLEGTWLRSITPTDDLQPLCVDCNDDTIAVSEACHRVSLLSLGDGALVGRFGYRGAAPGQLNGPRGLRLLPRGAGVVVADSGNKRVVVFSLAGDVVRVIPGFRKPFDVLPWRSDSGDTEESGEAGFLVASFTSHTVVRVSDDGAVLGCLGSGKRGVGAGDLLRPTALAWSPEGGVVVRENHGARFQVFQ